MESRLLRYTKKIWIVRNQSDFSHGKVTFQEDQSHEFLRSVGKKEETESRATDILQKQRDAARRRRLFCIYRMSQQLCVHVNRV